jgi:hypothetical protein
MFAIGKVSLDNSSLDNLNNEIKKNLKITSL